MNDPRLQRQLERHPYPLLFVTVAGAHAYGFAAADSSYELRGAHRLPLAEVVGLHTENETIEQTGIHDGLTVDVVTHDLRKFFELLAKKNGHALEQVLAPQIVTTSPEHEELKAIARDGITRHHAHHYMTLAESLWRVLLKEKPPQVVALLHVLRVLLTGIHLMKTGKLECDLPTLAGTLEMPQIAELVTRQRAGRDQRSLHRTEMDHFRREYEWLRGELEHAYWECTLPETPHGLAALNDLLVRLRLGATR